MPCSEGEQSVPTEVFQNQRKNWAGENAGARLNAALLFHPRASSQTILLGSGGSHENDASRVAQITTVSSAPTCPCSSCSCTAVFIVLFGPGFQGSLETMTFVYCDALDCACKNDWFMQWFEFRLLLVE